MRADYTTDDDDSETLRLPHRRRAPSYPGQAVSFLVYCPSLKAEKKWGMNGWTTCSPELSSSKLV